MCKRYDGNAKICLKYRVNKPLQNCFIYGELKMHDNTPITETLALGTLIKLSAAEIKRGKDGDKIKNAALNSLMRFGADFLPPDEFSVTSYGSGETLTPYEMAYRVVSSTKSNDLKALWYIFYPYLVVASPHIDETLYEKTRELLSASEVFAAVLSSRYRELVYDCGEDMLAAGLASVYTQWYEPYAEYKKEPTENGDTRETACYKKLLASGDFDAVKIGTERLLNLDPYNTDIALLNIAARVSGINGDAKTRLTELGETLYTVDEYLASATELKHLTYLHYYRALCLLGLAAGSGNADEAKTELEKCLEITPNFETARFMLKAIDDKYKKQ